MFELRPYQRTAVDKCIEFFKNGSHDDHPIIVAPTGAGKSIYIAYIANELGENVLVLQPSKELLEQNYEKYLSYGGEASIYSASLGEKEIGSVTFATIGSVVKVASEFQHVKYIIIDECHLVPPKEDSMFVTFLNGMKQAKVLGMTATPFRLKKYRNPFSGAPFAQINLLTRERPKFFNGFLHITQIKELYDQKFLSPITYAPLTWDSGKLVVNTNGSEYSDKSVEHELKQQKINERIPQIIKASVEKGRKHRVVFVYSVEDAMVLASKVPNSVYVCATTPKKEREQILKDFRAGKIITVFNVNVLTIGFDFTALDTIILARPTMSLALYMQMIGRGIRLHPGKTDCVVVDMCGNISRFSKFEDIEYKTDLNGKWIIWDGIRVLSGVPIDR
ncbi:MAG: DEAD/DEAH box helicase [Minisyncoccia bacterium]